MPERRGLRQVAATLTLLAWRFERRRWFVPDLNLIPVGIAKKHVRLTRAEFTVAEDRSTCLFDSSDGAFNVGRGLQPEAEVGDASAHGRLHRFSLKHNRVVRAWRLCLDEIVSAINGDNAQNMPIESECPLRVRHGQGNVSQSKCPHHDQGMCPAPPLTLQS